MSGAGRSTAAATFEDRGWFVIDNLPPALIGKVAELTSQAGAEYERVCLVAGRGGYEGIAELAPEIRRLRSTGARVRVVFLDAPDDVLVRRYEGTRRRHPVEATSVLSAIQQERAMLEVLRDEADVVVDTGELNVHQLHDRLIELVGWRRLHRRDADLDRVVRLQVRDPARRRSRLRLPFPAQPALGARAAAA